MSLRALLDGAVFAEVDGGAPLRIVVLHGWGRDRSDVVGVTDALAEHGLSGTAAIDLPGFGTSPPPAGAWGAADYAELTARAIEQLRDDDGTRPVIVGHSFGGRVAACLAASRPDLVGGVVLAGVPLLRTTGAPAAKPVWRYRIARTLHRRGLLSDQRIEALRRRHGSADYATASGVMRQVLVRVVAEDYTDELRAIKAPVAFVWGADDTAAPAEMARRAAALVPVLHGIEVIDGLGHDIHRDRPELLAQHAAELVMIEATR